MKSTILSALSVIGFSILLFPGCYTQLATVENRSEDDSYYDAPEDSAEYGEAQTDREAYDDSWQTRTYVGFDFYYPRYPSLYWGTVWYNDPFFCDPWYWDIYRPWYSRWYDPYYYSAYGAWYYRPYSSYAGYYPGYYSYYQPYVVYDRSLSRRETGYRRSGNVRSSSSGTYRPVTGEFTTSRPVGASRTSGSTSVESKRTESTGTRSGTTGTRRNETSSTRSTRGTSVQPRSRESQSSAGTRRDSGSSRSSESRGKDQSSYRAPSSSSRPSAPAPSSGGGSRSGGSNRSSGSSRGNR